LKDIANRERLLAGHRINYVPGWDCHGLPIELKAIGDKDKKKIDPITIRTKCLDFELAIKIFCINRFFKLQLESFRRQLSKIKKLNLSPGE